MILLDTHAWVWWVNDGPDLTDRWRGIIEANTESGIGVSVISCWEVAKLVQKGRLQLTIAVDQWLSSALAYPGVHLLELSPQIAVESTRLPGVFHSDPADQIIVATARVHGLALLTADSRMRAYEHVVLANERG